MAQTPDGVSVPGRAVLAPPGGSGETSPASLQHPEAACLPGLRPPSVRRGELVLTCHLSDLFRLPPLPVTRPVQWIQRPVSTTDFGS